MNTQLKIISLLFFSFVWLNTLAVVPSESVLKNSLKKDTTKKDTTKKAGTHQQPSTTPSSQQTSFTVYDVFNKDHPDTSDDYHRRAVFGDRIRILVHGMKGFLAKATQQHKEVKLFLDHVQIDKLTPISGAPDKDDNYFEFTLESNDKNSKVWAGLLGKPVKDAFFFKPTEVSVGLDGTYSEESTVKGFELIRIRPWWFAFGVVFLMVYFIFLFYMAKKTDLLRETGVNLNSLGLVRNKRLPYSLGKVQMAFWFSLVLASFLFIWMIANNYDTISAGVLGLIGISATTALSAVVIDDSKDQAVASEIPELRKRRDALIVEINALLPNDPARAAKDAEKKQLDADILKKENSLLDETAGFIDDILTDINGISFHRLQMSIWTIVLGFVFLYSVWATLTMPDFSATLLTLQGITAGTYLGFKFPEKQS